MSDLSGKTIQIPADLWDEWTARALRADAEYWRRKSFGAIPRLLSNLADEIERQHPPRMDEPGYGEHVSAAADGSVTGLREEYVRLPHPVQDSGIGEWVCIKHGLRSRWDELIDPRPVGGAS